MIDWVFTIMSSQLHGNTDWTLVKFIAAVDVYIACMNACVRVSLVSSSFFCSYSDDVSMVLSDFLTCQPWPSEQQRVRHIPVSAAPVSQQQASNSAPSDDYFGWGQPNDRTFEFSSSMRTRIWSFFTVATVIANLCFV